MVATMADAHFLFCKWRPLAFIIFLGVTQIFYFTRSLWSSEVDSKGGSRTTLEPPFVIDLGEQMVIKLEQQTFPPVITAYQRSVLDEENEEQPEIFRPTSSPGLDMSKYMLNQRLLPLVEEVILDNKKLKGNTHPSENAIRNLFYYEDVDFKKYMLNATAAQDIRVNVPVGKVVPSLCLNKTYPSFNVKVSIIIPFHNELWAVLLRCVQGIIRRSPSHVIHEIILIDDKSEKDNLRGPLLQYLQLVAKTRLLRTERREGLIRARMAAARKATGNILVFMDAHVEVATGWLEPLLDVIKKDRKTIAIPTVDHINPKTMKYNPVYYRTRGSFGWELDYVWKDESDDIFFDRDVEPFNSGTMIGCAFAVERDAFFEFGGYDESMQVWGGENLEIAFRTWMCGGSMKVVPCSHIGHIYRAILPYNFTQATLFQNLQRVADVWMDDYRDIYFRTIGHEFIFNKEDSDAIQLRSQLRKDLKCKDFKWFLENVTPEIVIPDDDAVFFGQLRNLQSRFCLTVNESTQVIHFDYCTLYARNQVFTYTKSSLLMHGSTCVMSGDEDGDLQLGKCGVNSRFTYDYFFKDTGDFKKKLVGVDQRKPYALLTSKHSGSCLGKEGNLINSTLSMQPCDQSNPLQYWIFTHKLGERRE